jgi:hypothetical protein
LELLRERTAPDERHLELATEVGLKSRIRKQDALSALFQSRSKYTFSTITGVEPIFFEIF